jgi:prophage tail gpP-like protein
MKRLLYWLMLGVLLAGILAGCAAPAPEVIEKEVEVTRVVEVEKEVEVPAEVQTWELVSPAGALNIEPLELASRISTLEGKTVGLKWNSKPNGNLVLDRIAELLIEQVPNVTVLKFYELEPTTVPQSASAEIANEKAEIIASYNPDIVIASQCD